ncbi:MAG: hypothetical protein KDB53_20495, partial [Planctomycetes bacterium]|nr:hypothetical protein [Planctomycetota bacterium]
YLDRSLDLGAVTWFRAAAVDGEGKLVASGWIDAGELDKLLEQPGGPAQAMVLAALPASWKSDERAVATKTVGPPTRHEKWPEWREVEARVIVPEGLAPAALQATVSAAAWELAERTRADRVRLLANRAAMPDAAIPTAATVRLDLVPASTEDPSSFKPKLEVVINPAYSQTLAKAIADGTRVTIEMDENSAPVYAAAAGVEPTGKVTWGSRGYVRESRAVMIDAKPVTRYRIEVDSGIEGWIDARFLKVLD